MHIFPLPVHHKDMSTSHKSISSKGLRSSRGSAALMGVGIMLGFAVVWAIFYAVTTWIYNSSHEREAKNKEQFVERATGKGKKKVRPKEPTRDVGGYKVECRGLIWKTCEQVFEEKTP